MSSSRATTAPMTGDHRRAARPWNKMEAAIRVSVVLRRSATSAILVRQRLRIDEQVGERAPSGFATARLDLEVGADRGHVGQDVGDGGRPAGAAAAGRRSGGGCPWMVSWKRSRPPFLDGDRDGRGAGSPGEACHDGQPERRHTGSTACRPPSSLGEFRPNFVRRRQRESPGSRVHARPGLPTHTRAVACSGFARRSQWRDRAGFTPASSFRRRLRRPCSHNHH